MVEDFKFTHTFTERETKGLQIIVPVLTYKVREKEVLLDKALMAKLNLSLEVYF